jgi:cytochrome b6-f complex iron-sulfur subunit
MKRHEFIKQFAFGGSILLTAPVIFSSCSKDEDDPGLTVPGNEFEIDLESATFASLKTVGGYAYNGNIIIIRSAENQYLAFAKACTHQGVTVVYQHATGRLVCNQHGSIFSNTGAVVNGPATQALRRYNTTVSGSKLIIS